MDCYLIKMVYSFLLQVLSLWPLWRLREKSQIIRYVCLCSCCGYHKLEDNNCHINVVKNIAPDKINSQ